MKSDIIIVSSRPPFRFHSCLSSVSLGLLRIYTAFLHISPPQGIFGGASQWLSRTHSHTSLFLLSHRLHVISGIPNKAFIQKSALSLTLFLPAKHRFVHFIHLMTYIVYFYYFILWFAIVYDEHFECCCNYTDRIMIWRFARIRSLAWFEHVLSCRRIITAENTFQ